MDGNLRRRFWSKVDVRGPDECWPWLASHHRQGYGWFRYKGRMRLSHRIAYMLNYGLDVTGDDVVICHSCDNPNCVNPRHLFCGTQQDNIADMDAKGRRPRGERVQNAKLTNLQADTIRQLYKTGDYLQRELARRFGIDKSVVSRIVNGKAY